MTRYQACRALGLDPLSTALVTFLNFMAGVAPGKVGIMHTIISYDKDAPYKRGTRYSIEEDK